MNDLFFVCMDIVEETKNVVNAATPSCTVGMTRSELAAYNLGITNTLSALNGMVYTDRTNEFALHIDGFETPTEFDKDDLICLLSNLIGE